MADHRKKTRIAALGDIHVGELVQKNYQELFQHISRDADVLAIAGDLTQRGTIRDTELLLDQLTYCSVPVVCVLGNHDYENNLEAEITSMLRQRNIQVLDGISTIIEGVAFVGSKGFGGGFDGYALSSFGEPLVKKFVKASLDEALLLEKALRDVGPDIPICVVLHYSPIRSTVEGEPVDIFPFLGSSRLLEPLERFDVTTILHGHAHHGTHEGKTQKGIPVYNVSLPLLESINPEKPYKLLQL